MRTTLVITGRASPAIEEILTFWFESPARDAAELFTKFRRWYQGGEALDEPIRLRFGHFIERALDHDLRDWCSSPHGSLALVLLLDQFTRNAHRGTPRAYAGDPRALAIALELLDSGADRSFSLEERLFVAMPLVHSESLLLQERAVGLADELAREAPPEQREAWQLGCVRTRLYRDIIARFGRFPARNAILGRKSTPEELAFLEEQARAPLPLPNVS